MISLQTQQPQHEPPTQKLPRMSSLKRASADSARVKPGKVHFSADFTEVAEFSDCATDVLNGSDPAAKPHKKRKLNSDKMSNGNSENAENAELNFDRQMCSSYVSKILETLAKDKNPSGIIKLTSQLAIPSDAPGSLSSETLSYILQALAAHTARLDTPGTTQYTSSLILAAIRLSNWSERGNRFTRSYISFLTVLISTIPRWWPEVAGHVIAEFATLSVEKTAAHHSVLQFITKNIPTAVSELVNGTVRQFFPHINSEGRSLVCYVENLLKFLEYAGELGGYKSVWGLIIERCIALDVELQNELDEIDEEDLESGSEFGSDSEDEDESEVAEDAEGSDSDSDSDSEGSDGENSEAEAEFGTARQMAQLHTETGKLQDKETTENTSNRDDAEDGSESEMPSDSENESDEENYEEEEEIYLANTVADVRALSDKLDSLVSTLLGYLDRKFNSIDEGETGESDKSLDLFEALLSLFNSHILPTHYTRATQYLLFKISQTQPMLMDTFLVSLIDVAFSASQAFNKRIKAMQYISSYIARAKKLSRDQIVFVVEYLVKWMERYITEREKEVTEILASSVHHAETRGMERFKMLYATFQSLMYIFCFRHGELRLSREDGLDLEAAAPPVASKGKSEWAASLDVFFQRSILTKFNPLKYCNENVVMIFAKIAQAENVAYCFSIIERNKRERLMGALSQSNGSSGKSEGKSEGPARSVSASPSKQDMRKLALQPKKSSSVDDMNFATVGSAGGSYMFSQRQEFVDIEAYFPFDPLYLRDSRRLLGDFYIEWSDVDGDMSSDDDSE